MDVHASWLVPRYIPSCDHKTAQTTTDYRNKTNRLRAATSSLSRRVIVCRWSSVMPAGHSWAST